MPTVESLVAKIEDNFKKLPTITAQRDCLVNLKVIMELRIEEENKALQEAINNNLKLL